MDGDRFDALTRRWAQTGTRRSLLRGLGGGLAALGIGAAAHRSAAAVICRQNGVLCAKGAQCCAGYCDGKTNRCSCPPGQTLCGDTCKVLDSDLANCGACGNVCPDRPNTAATTCIYGTCGFTCAPGFANCNNNPNDGCETNLGAWDNCGACGNVCTTNAANAMPRCNGGTCEFQCFTGYKKCGDTCIPAGSCCNDADCDSANTGLNCVNNACRCPDGTTFCGNAGRCQVCCQDNDCPNQLTCQAGACGCPSGQVVCGANYCCYPCRTASDCPNGWICDAGLCKH